jgi:hypothetical protein
MPPELKRFFTYWSLTFAVLIFYTLAALVAGLDIWEKIMDNVRKRRAQLKPKGPLLDPNPLKGMNIAATIGMGPGQQPNEKRQWVLDRATEVAKRLKLNVGILVLEDNKEHPLVQITDAKNLKAYRVDKTWVAEARAGNVEREGQIKDLLERYLASDFLGIEDVRPKRTTELAREAAAKPSPAARQAQPAQETPATESQDPE